MNKLADWFETYGYELTALILFMLTMTILFSSEPKSDYATPALKQDIVQSL